MGLNFSGLTFFFFLPIEASMLLHTLRNHLIFLLLSLSSFGISHPSDDWNLIGTKVSRLRFPLFHCKAFNVTLPCETLSFFPASQKLHIYPECDIALAYFKGESESLRASKYAILSSASSWRGSIENKSIAIPC